MLFPPDPHLFQVPHDLQAEDVHAFVSRMLGDGFVITLYATQTLAIHQAYDITIGSLKEAKKMGKLKVCSCSCPAHVSMPL